MLGFTCYVTRRDDIPRLVEVTAHSIGEARKAALAGQPGRVSCRYSDAIGTMTSRAVESARRNGDAL